MSVFEMARKYYPRLWDESRLKVLAAAGRLTLEEMEAVINSDVILPSPEAGE